MTLKMMSSISWMLLIVTSFLQVESANILAIFPTPSYSHQMPLLSVARELAKRGHNLTVISTNPLEKPMPNYTDIDISFSYEMWRPKGDQKALFNLQKRMSAMELLFQFQSAMSVSLETQLNSTIIQKFIKYVDTEKPKFDLVLYEDLSHVAWLGFLPKIGNPPLVSMLTLALPCGFDFSFGNECNPSYTPDIMSGFSNKMTFYERFQNYWLIFFIQKYFNKNCIDIQEELKRKYFGFDSPTGLEMSRNKSILILSSNWLFTYARPVSPNLIMVGPLHIGEIKPLPKDLESWVEGSKEGVIYFSLGSNMRSASLEIEKRNAILEAFAKFPNHRIIWKWEEEELPGLPSNVICRKWLPQHDLLAHPKIKLFITQGGLQSFQESVYFEVPMLGIPFFADQDYNVKKLKILGVGDQFDFEELESGKLYDVMYELLYNKTYMETVKRISLLSKTQMMSPRDSAVWWIEYVLKSGGDMSHLQPDFNNLSWIQYHCLDIMVVSITPFLILFFVIYKIFKSCTKKAASDKVKKQ